MACPSQPEACAWAMDCARAELPAAAFAWAMAVAVADACCSLRPWEPGTQGAAGWRWRRWGEGCTRGGQVGQQAAHAAKSTLTLGNGECLGQSHCSAGVACAQIKLVRWCCSNLFRGERHSRNIGFKATGMHTKEQRAQLIPGPPTLCHSLAQCLQRKGGIGGSNVPGQAVMVAQ